MTEPATLRILFVFDNLELSGADKVAVNMIRAAAQDPTLGITARGIVCMADKTGDVCAGNPVLIANPDVSDTTPIWRKIFYGMRAIQCCARIARDADVVVGVTPPAVFVAKCAAWLNGKPAVAWAHYDIEGWQRELDDYSRSLPARFFEVLFYRWIVPRFQNVVFVSKASLQSMETRFGGITKHWVHIPNLFSESGFATLDEDLRELTALKAGNVPTLLFLGRLSRQKRWQDAIRLMEILAQRNHTAHLVVIGDGVERRAFLDRLANSSARSRIHWLGQLRNPMRALSLVDALILTSLYEAWPVVILEAFHCQVPVVAYSCPSGPAEMLAEGRGIYCQESPEAMADAIAELFSMSMDQRTTMLQAASSFLGHHRAEVVMPIWKEYAKRLINYS